MEQDILNGSPRYRDSRGNIINVDNKFKRLEENLGALSLTKAAKEEVAQKADLDEVRALKETLEGLVGVVDGLKEELAALKEQVIDVQEQMRKKRSFV